MKLNKPLFYILSFTWGLPFTLLGCIFALCLRLQGLRSEKWGWCRVFQSGGSWGGMNAGLFFVTDGHSDDALRDHEFGHAIQNCIFGPFMIPLIAIPSFLRYWYRELQTRSGKPPKTGYYGIWFEAQASRLGEKYRKESENI